MNDLAYVIAVKASRALSELSEIYEMIHVLDADGDFASIKPDIGKVMANIDDLVRQPALNIDDAVRIELVRRMEKFGRFL